MLITIPCYFDPKFLFLNPHKFDPKFLQLRFNLTSLHFYTQKYRKDNKTWSTLPPLSRKHWYWHPSMEFIRFDSLSMPITFSTIRGHTELCPRNLQSFIDCIVRSKDQANNSTNNIFDSILDIFLGWGESSFKIDCWIQLTFRLYSCTFQRLLDVIRSNM